MAKTIALADPTGNPDARLVGYCRAFEATVAAAVVGCTFDDVLIGARPQRLEQILSQTHHRLGTLARAIARTSADTAEGMIAKASAMTAYASQIGVTDPRDVGHLLGCSLATDLLRSACLRPPARWC